MNLYTDLIWFYFLEEIDLNFFDQNMIVRAKKLIKQQMQ